MKKLLLIPAIFFPYSFVFGFLISESYSAEDFAIYILLGFVALFLFLPLICNTIFIILSRNDDPRKLLRVAFIVKIVHIPSYVIIFLLGLGASIMFFMTFPLILMFVLFDCLVLFISSSISVFALAKNIKNNKSLSIVALVCQFIFCADVISLLVLQIVSKKQNKRIST